jgi:hypothetical protein
MKSSSNTGTIVDNKPNISIYFLIFVLLLSILAILVLASVPPVSRDELTHHLAIPKLYLEKGGIYEIPSMEYSYYPMNLDLLYMIPLALGNDIVPKFIHFSFALLTAWIIYFFLKKRLNEVYGLLGSLFFLTLPIIVQLSITAYVDLGLVFFSAASMMLVLEWLEKGRIRFLFLAGICCGIALGVKYNGIILLAILFFSTIFLHLRTSENNKPIKSVWFGLLFLAIAVFVFSPWLLRNFFWTGNPVYPLFKSIFNTEALSSTQGLPPLLERKLLYHEQWWQILLVPLRIFFSGQDNVPQYFDGKLSPFLLILPVFSLLEAKDENKLQRLEKLMLFAFSIIFLFIVFFQTVMRIRYVAPIIPPLVILSMFGLRNIANLCHRNFFSSLKPATSIIHSILILTMLLFNFSYIFQEYHRFKPIEFISGKVSRQEYISRFRPEYPVIDWANRNLPLQSKILALSLGNRSYYFNREVMFDLKNLKSIFCEIIKTSNTDNEVTQKLYRIGITHILVRYEIFQDWIRNDLTHDQQIRLNSFFLTQTKKLAEFNNHGLYGLLVSKPAEKEY